MSQSTFYPKHHPTEECLLAYANGGMGEAESLLIATHLALCPECRKTAQIGECVGSQLLEDAKAVPVSATCRDKLFAALDQTECSTTATNAASVSVDCFIPEPLRGYLGGAGCRSGLQQLIWQTITPGQTEYPLALTECCLRRGATAKLIALKPQTMLTTTTTGQKQILLLLCGSLSQDATSYGPGDVIKLQPGAAVQAAAESCFALVVTTAHKDWRTRWQYFKRFFKA